jgi:hypothetical protein
VPNWVNAALSVRGKEMVRTEAVCVAGLAALMQQGLSPKTPALLRTLDSLVRRG